MRYIFVIIAFFSVGLFAAIPTSVPFAFSNTVPSCSMIFDHVGGVANISVVAVLEQGSSQRSTIGLSIGSNSCEPVLCAPGSSYVYRYMEVKPGTNIILKLSRLSSDYGTFSGTVLISVTGFCPSLPGCQAFNCDVCGNDICAVHESHYTRCYQCHIGNTHCHCSNSQALLDQWYNAAMSRPICPDCGAECCPLCVHQCGEFSCPNLPSCSFGICTVCGSQYCNVHTFHLCSNFTRYDGDLTGIISSHTTISGSANVTVEFESAGLESSLQGINTAINNLLSPVNDISDKLDVSNTNTSGILSELSNFSSSTNQHLGTIRANQSALHDDNVVLQGLVNTGNSRLSEIGSGISDLGDGIDAVVDGVDALGEGVTDGFSDVITALNDQIDVIDTISRSITTGNAPAAESVEGEFSIDSPDSVEEYSPLFPWIDVLSEKCSIPDNYFNIGDDDLKITVPLEISRVYSGWDDFDLEFDLCDESLDPIKSVLRGFSSVVMVLVFAISIIKIVAGW